MNVSNFASLCVLTPFHFLNLSMSVSVVINGVDSGSEGNDGGIDGNVMLACPESAALPLGLLPDLLKLFRTLLKLLRTPLNILSISTRLIWSVSFNVKMAHTVIKTLMAPYANMSS